MEADEALIQSRGVREETEDVRSTKVEATRTMSVVHGCGLDAGNMGWV